MSSKIYCGSGRIITTNYGNMPKIKLHKDDVNTIVKWMKENKSDWINIDMKEKPNTEQGKPTHYLEVDEWKPEPKTGNEEIRPDKPEKGSVTDTPPPHTEDDLPF